jgi:glycosyltransferase involved in cell wall biosynthesis
MSKMPSISACFPAYNDEATIGGLVATVQAVLKEITDDFEIVVVNDCSPDRTAEVLRQVAEKVPELRVVTHEKNRGYGGALMSAFKVASKETVFYTDGDGQYDVNELKLLSAVWSNTTTDVVNGFKEERQDNIIRILVGQAYAFCMRILFWLPIRDVDCDFRLMRTDILQKIELSRTSGAICVELVKKLERAGAIFKEVPVTHLPRLHGRSQFFTVSRITATLRDLAALWIELFIRR